MPRLMPHLMPQPRLLPHTQVHPGGEAGGGPVGQIQRLPTNLPHQGPAHLLPGSGAGEAQSNNCIGMPNGKLYNCPFNIIFFF